eukprot:569190-Amphidinium_carterae.4
MPIAYHQNKVDDKFTRADGSSPHAASQNYDLPFVMASTANTDIKGGVAHLPLVCLKILAPVFRLTNGFMEGAMPSLGMLLLRRLPVWRRCRSGVVERKANPQAVIKGELTSSCRSAIHPGRRHLTLRGHKWTGCLTSVVLWAI